MNALPQAITDQQLVGARGCGGEIRRV